MNATPSQALRALAMGPSPEDRQAAAIALLSHDRDIALEAAPTRERLASVLEGAWHEIHSSRPDLVAGLVATVRTDPGLLTIEVAASALALEGEDGVTELLTLGAHSDFAVRSKVAIGLSLLGRSARWAVPTLIRFMDREPLEYVWRHIVATLGRIGGREAIAKLKGLLWDAQGAKRWELAAEIRAALEQASTPDLPTDHAEAKQSAIKEIPLVRLPAGVRNEVTAAAQAEDEEESQDDEEDEDEELRRVFEMPATGSTRNGTWLVALFLVRGATCVRSTQIVRKAC